MIHENASDGESKEFSLVFRGSSLEELHKEVTPQSSTGLKTALPRNSESLTLRPSRTGIWVLWETSRACGKNSDVGRKCRLGSHTHTPAQPKACLPYSSDGKDMWNTCWHRPSSCPCLTAACLLQLLQRLCSAHGWITRYPWRVRLQTHYLQYSRSVQQGRI